jgi:hypothetical protein
VRNRKVQLVLAFAGPAGFLAYIILLFARL